MCRNKVTHFQETNHSIEVREIRVNDNGESEISLKYPPFECGGSHDTYQIPPLKYVPKFLYDYPDVSSIDLSFNKTRVFYWHGGCEDARGLSLIPPEFKGFLKLKSLNLAINSFEVIDNLPENLKFLSVLGNNITSLKDICKHDKLETLITTCNNISCSDDEGFDHLPSLKFLDMSHNKLVSFGAAQFSSLKHLEILYLNYNTNLEIIDLIMCCCNLTTLNISGCYNLKRITFAPDMSQLKNLSMASCNLSHIPEGVCNLVNLEKLILSNNCIETLPDKIVNLEKLIELHMNRNPRFTVPTSMNQGNFIVYAEENDVDYGQVTVVRVSSLPHLKIYTQIKF